MPIPTSRILTLYFDLCQAMPVTEPCRPVAHHRLQRTLPTAADLYSGATFPSLALTDGWFLVRVSATMCHGLASAVSDGECQLGKLSVNISSTPLQPPDSEVLAVSFSELDMANVNLPERL